MINQFPHLEAIETRATEAQSIKDAMTTGIPQPFAVRTTRGGHLINIHGETRMGPGRGTVYSDPALGPYLNMEPNGVLQRSMFDPFSSGVRVDYAPGSRPE